MTVPGAEDMFPRIQWRDFVRKEFSADSPSYQTVEVFAMSEGKDPRSKQDFETRIHRLRGEQPFSEPNGKPGAASESHRSGLAVATRVGTEMIAALGVGIGIGLVLDRWLETKPWLLILFALLGGAAGILNVFRLVNNLGYSAGYKRPSPGSQTKNGTTDDEPGDRLSG